MKEIAAYKANDGSLFETADDCQEHEVTLVWHDRIKDFTASGLNPYPNGAYAKMTRKLLVAWEKYKAL